MIKVALVDDDENCIFSLRALLRKFPKIKIVAESTSVDAAKTAIMQERPNIVFLDVEMPEKNGFDLVNELDEIDFDIVFTTAFDKYAVQAIKASALDFLHKPITEKDMQETLVRFEAKNNKDNIIRQVEILLENYGRSFNKKIVVPTNNGLEFINTNQIVRLEAENTYTTFFFSDNSKLVVAKTLKEIEELLPTSVFFRVHHSHLINLSYIKRYQKSDGGALIMEDKTSIPVSRHRKEELVRLIRK